MPVNCGTPLSIPIPIISLSPSKCELALDIEPPPPSLLVVYSAALNPPQPNLWLPRPLLSVPQMHAQTQVW